MQLFNTKYSLRTENYSKRTPETLKKIADALLGTILVVDPIIIGIPDFEHKEWLIWGWNAFVVLFKYVTKLIAEEVTNDQG